MIRIGRGLLALAGTAALAAAPPLRAQEPGPKDAAHPDSATRRVEQVKRERTGAGLRIGGWMVSNLASPSGTTSSSIPDFEAYWQKGLDRHLAIETSAGLWHRQQTSGSGATAETIGTFVVPLLTTIKLYPFTGPEQALEPFVSAGVGFTVGLEKDNTVSGGLLGGGNANSGLNLVAGVGVKGGAGVEYRFSRAFGVSAALTYQWVLFAQDVGGQGDYKGFGLFGGLTYRFQY